MKTSKILQAAIGVAFALGAQQAAQANTFSYSFDILTSCSPASCNGLGASPWGSLSFTDIGAGAVQMTFALENIADHTGIDISPTAWDKHLYLNYSGSNSLGFAFSSGVAANQITQSSNNFTNGNQGSYDIDIVFSGGALNPNENSVYTITGSGLTASMFNTLSSGSGDHYYAGIEILKDNNDPQFDARIAAIPEPESYAMMLAGLGLMGFVARRRKQNEA
jgi:hypothetical protein